jgi:hypothetical protein
LAAGTGCYSPRKVGKASRQEAYPLKYFHVKTYDIYSLLKTNKQTNKHGSCVCSSSDLGDKAEIGGLLEARS